MAVFKDISYGAPKELFRTLDIYLPQKEHFDVFLYFHGGGFVCGDKADVGPIADYLTSRGIAVVSANYRIGTGVRWPGYIQDAAAAVAWAMKHLPEYGQCGKFYVGGSSAGGYLSMMLCFNRQYLEPYGIHPTDIAGYIHDSGQPTAHFSVLEAKGLHPDRIIVDETAPLFYVGLEPRYSPMLILIADQDIGNRYEQTLLLVSTLKQFKIPPEDIVLKVMHGLHCQHTGALDENGESITGRLIDEFIRQHP
ncbi:MAG: alpha/beta hydrolase [Oscillospiraceae bacterium]|nr:alpha/beta hydrolase [Oscillospiraceae bacterium]